MCSMTADEMVAYALEAPPELLPFLPELLADLDELGSDAAQIAGILRDLPLPPTTQVVDLGCGKGRPRSRSRRNSAYACSASSCSSRS